MLTPVELQNATLKTGIGYNKKEVDHLLEEVSQDYEKLYKENLELKDKLAILSDGLQYYKEMEKTLQKTLVVAEKTAEEVQRASEDKAFLIEEKARTKAAYIIEDAKKQARGVYDQTLALVQQYENYRIQHKSLAAAQIELLDSEAFQIRCNTQPPEFLMEEEEKSVGADAFAEKDQPSNEKGGSSQKYALAPEEGTKKEDAPAGQEGLLIGREGSKQDEPLAPEEGTEKGDNSAGQEGLSNGREGSRQDEPLAPEEGTEKEDNSAGQEGLSSGREGSKPHSVSDSEEEELERPGEREEEVGQ